ncbi:BirA family biotin operon repressor/biotin-[acetyl-CoA-carboxylase] ligase [Sphaerotilus hippei]|uniref:biotin--[biotin carboxyl-carrier protein] ligase n=1 Tax=Sphaerotilus hippei TaxID=744406 RepID=A0A318H6K9_9BURK|nr:biotin--[acetyl-CoA-carboxylase] ligase [Sphaerotilus hippei]PXW99515.1 BirA family biotin operon repressor/biotin-[acetyl-CoA-carboxylase] ligase [Sphaerotilus hippei]
MLHWDAETLWQLLLPLAPDLSVEVLPRTGSTNTSLMERARAGDTSTCLMVAEQQTAGRGRLGRPWWSEPGGSLTFSLGLRYAPRDWSGLSLAVGLALARALDPSAPPRLGIKWPNDLWLTDGADRKLGGILIETVALPGDPEGRWTVIGCGLNILARPAAGPSAGPEGGFRTGYAGVQELQPDLDAPRTLHRIAAPLLQALQAFERDGLAPLLPAYAERDVLAGRTVSAGELRGTAIGPDRDGQLRVRRDDGTLQPVASGEVSVRPC